MNNKIKEKVKEVARYYILNKSTVRKTADKFGIGKTTVHVYLSKYLKNIDYELGKEAQNILIKNKLERYMRGGVATQKRYKELKK